MDFTSKVAQRLKKDAGLKRINISLDSLNETTAAKKCSKRCFKTVLENSSSFRCWIKN